MESINIEETEKGFFRIPNLTLNAETGFCELKGEAFMENSLEFFTQINNWLTEYNNVNCDIPINFTIYLTYFNTSSSKMLLNLVNHLSELHKQGQEISLNWQHDSDDFEIQEDIMDICYDTDLEINIESV